MATVFSLQAAGLSRPTPKREPELDAASITILATFVVALLGALALSALLVRRAYRPRPGDGVEKGTRSDESLVSVAGVYMLIARRNLLNRLPEVPRPGGLGNTAET